MWLLRTLKPPPQRDVKFPPQEHTCWKITSVSNYPWWKRAITYYHSGTNPIILPWAVGRQQFIPIAQQFMPCNVINVRAYRPFINIPSVLCWHFLCHFVRPKAMAACSWLALANWQFGYKSRLAETRMTILALPSNCWQVGFGPKLMSSHYPWCIFWQAIVTAYPWDEFHLSNTYSFSVEILSDH